MPVMLLISMFVDVGALKRKILPIKTDLSAFEVCRIVTFELRFQMNKFAAVIVTSNHWAEVASTKQCCHSCYYEFPNFEFVMSQGTQTDAQDLDYLYLGNDCFSMLILSQFLIGPARPVIIFIGKRLLFGSDSHAGPAIQKSSHFSLFSFAFRETKLLLSVTFSFLLAFN